MIKWTIFEKPVMTREKTCYGILNITMGQLLLCNDGKGYYGCLNSNIRDNISFRSTLCGNDIETAKQEIIVKFVKHLSGISQLCNTQLSQLQENNSTPNF